jgi:hypothetical protein
MSAPCRFDRRTTRLATIMLALALIALAISALRLLDA